MSPEICNDISEKMDKIRRFNLKVLFEDFLQERNKASRKKFIFQESEWDSFYHYLQTGSFTTVTLKYSTWSI
jgi:hypothetical protein